MCLVTNEHFYGKKIFLSPSSFLVCFHFFLLLQLSIVSSSSYHYHYNVVNVIQKLHVEDYREQTFIREIEYYVLICLFERRKYLIKILFSFLLLNSDNFF